MNTESVSLNVYNNNKKKVKMFNRIDSINHAHFVMLQKLNIQIRKKYSQNKCLNLRIGNASVTKGRTLYNYTSL